MTKLLIGIISLIAFSATTFANEEEQYSRPKKIRSFSLENGYLELKDLKVKYIKYSDEDDEEGKLVSTKALISLSGESELELMLIAKKNNWKIAFTYNPENVEETEDCEGYQAYTKLIKSDDEDYEDYYTCFIVRPDEIIIY